MALDLSPVDREWIKRKWTLIRQSQIKADAANIQWNRINDEINDKHRRESERRAERGEFPLTDLMKVQDKSASIPLRDAYDTGIWHSRNAERHIHDVQLFLQLKTLELL